MSLKVPPFSADITKLLVQWNEGDEAAFDELVPMVYQELSRLAVHYMRGERADHTLQATALVHEAYLELRKWRGFSWVNRAQFLGVAANMMRRILSNYARQHRAEKRGGGVHPVAISQAENIGHKADLDLLAVDEALNQLESQHALAFRVVELKFYGGLNTEEIAEILEVSTSTVERSWRFGKAWLYDRLASAE